MDYLHDVLELLDLIIREMFRVPVFAIFMGGFVMAAALGVLLLIKGAAVVSAQAAEVFAAANLLLYGNESQTVGPEDAPMAVHKILLGAGVILLEGIRLAAVPEGVYLLNAAPLNLGGAEGSPCRAILISDEN